MRLEAVWRTNNSAVSPLCSPSALKAAPLALPLPGILLGRRYTYQWSSMLVLAYLAEGVVRAWSERGGAQWLAGAEIGMSLAFFAAAVGYARLSGPNAQ